MFLRSKAEIFAGIASKEVCGRAADGHGPEDANGFPYFWAYALMQRCASHRSLGHRTQTTMIEIEIRMYAKEVWRSADANEVKRHCGSGGIGLRSRPLAIRSSSDTCLRPY